MAELDPVSELITADASQWLATFDDMIAKAEELAAIMDQLEAQFVGQASLCALAGADMDAVTRWIPQGVTRGENIQASLAAW